MSNLALKQLRSLTQAIVDPTCALSDLIPQAQQLRDFFELQLDFVPDGSCDIGDGATRLASGLAISPTLAAMCVRELYRTLAFIRGLHDAIGDQLRSDRPVRVLYAGCGPYATLALPLMTIFSPQQVRFTLLDIHQACLDSAQVLLARLGVSDCLDECVCADATCYQIPTNAVPDVIVSETMAVCLRNEPQVSIMRNLFRQAPMATLVPQSVSVALCLLNSAKEHVLMPADYVGEIPEPVRDRVCLGKVFELDAVNLNAWSSVSDRCLPATQIQLPAVLDIKYTLYLLTHIVVYGQHVLQDYDCSLTYPQRLARNVDFAGNEKLQFYYQLGDYPELKFVITE